MEKSEQVRAIAADWVQAMSNGILTQNSGGGKMPSVEMSFVKQEDADKTYDHLIALALAVQGRPLPEQKAAPDEPHISLVAAEATARLFAAAPDLYAALKQARREWGAFTSLSGETLLQIDAALRKAEATS